MTKKQHQAPDQVALPCGLPISICTTEEDVQAVMQAAGSVSYILGVKPGAKATDIGTIQAFKLVKNMIGYALVPVKEDDLDLVYLEQQAWFNLPNIPIELVKDLDAFFRLVDDKLGTESIALLTYDPKYLNADNDKDGWGVLIPKQSNTAGSCNYDPISVAEKKEDGVMIVGSAHSHPNMKAFASHTDIGDQANFDGIHITYGWDRNSKQTEYHIELQMGGGRFNMKPAQVFEQEPDEEPSDEVKEWAENVEKAMVFKKLWVDGAYNNLRKQIEIPEVLPSPKEAGIVVDILPGETKCPACDTYIIKSDEDRRRCKECNIYLAYKGEDYADIIIERGNAKPSFETFELIPDKATEDAFHWHRFIEGNKVLHSVEILFEVDPKQRGKAGSGKA